MKISFTGLLVATDFDGDADGSDFEDFASGFGRMGFPVLDLYNRIVFTRQDCRWPFGLLSGTP